MVAGLNKKTTLFPLAFFLIFMSSYASACTISTNGVNFGTYASNQSSPLDGQGSVIVNCADTLPYTIELDDGGNSTGYLGRRMFDGVNYIAYSLYRDSSRTLPWGVVASGDALSGTGNGLNQTLDVYGRIPGNQNVPQGTYSDTVGATVTF